MRPCFLCNKKVYTLKFTNDKLKICRQVLALRKKSNLVFKDTVIPKNSLNIGYHQLCYNRFRVVKIQHDNSSGVVEEKEKPTKKLLRSTSAGSDKNLIEIVVAKEEINMIDFIKPKLEPIGSYQVEFEAPSSPFDNEINGIKPDIAEGTILKSILMRKLPIRKVMMNNFEAFI